MFSKLRNSESVARAAAERSSNGAVAGEIKTCAPAHAMNGQGWEPCQVGYHSDSSNDGYFSCEDSLSTYQIDDVEMHHRARFERMFECLV
ncbi:hypothetical protein PIB30_099240 [Stylosanthes scabra]|uniref:Uncharacterized protein n=1 Tax=Stylosanthes scabra TaxID=79078 RepID=A0ABU6WZW0_9FABA|nr:hypothetical protein [Stylosanthes scabra]